MITARDGAHTTVTYLFPDTNIFMHFRWIAEIDWCEIVGTEVTLVVAHSVVRELDKHKSLHPKKHLRSRASAVVQRLRDILDPGGGQIVLRERTSLLWSFKKPEITSFADHDLDRAAPDDQLLAAVIDFGRANPGSSPFVVTDDLGLELHARQHRVGVLRLDERFRLADERDPVEVENRELKRQLAIYRDASPRLVVALQGQTPPFTVSMPAVERVTDELRQRLLRRAKERHPYMHVRSEMADDEAAGAIDALMRSQPTLGWAAGSYRYQPSDEQISRYNEALTKYLEQYETTYLPELAEHRDFLASALCIKIQLYNEGSAPAEDVTIELALPANTVGLAKLPSAPMPPEPPRKPGVMSVDRGIEGLTIPLFRPGYSAEPEPNVSGPFLEEGVDADRATFYVHRLKHLSAERLGELYVVFNAPEEVGNFKIEYRLVVGNMPEATSGALNITVGDEQRPRGGGQKWPRR